VKELKTHPWLLNVEWDEMYEHSLKSPYVPSSADNFDSKAVNMNFKDNYSEEAELQRNMRENAHPSVSPMSGIAKQKPPEKESSEFEGYYYDPRLTKNEEVVSLHTHSSRLSFRK
jgi:hypothetical protein